MHGSMNVKNKITVPWNVTECGAADISTLQKKLLSLPTDYVNS